MPSYSTFAAKPAGVCLPYNRATAAQQTLAAAYLRQRLRPHFPALRPGTWARALAARQPARFLVENDP